MVIYSLGVDENTWKKRRRALVEHCRDGKKQKQVITEPEEGCADKLEEDQGSAVSWSPKKERVVNSFRRFKISMGFTMGIL